MIPSNPCHSNNLIKYLPWISSIARISKGKAEPIGRGSCLLSSSSEDSSAESSSLLGSVGITCRGSRLRGLATSFVPANPSRQSYSIPSGCRKCRKHGVGNQGVELDGCVVLQVHRECVKLYLLLSGGHSALCPLRWLSADLRCTKSSCMLPCMEIIILGISRHQYLFYFSVNVST